jgi:hypothetical protein
VVRNHTRGPDDAKTLKDVKYQIGDFMDIAVMTGPEGGRGGQGRGGQGFGANRDRNGGGWRGGNQNRQQQGEAFGTFADNRRGGGYNDLRR